jgi:calcineurin-like phosphoesterase family protein
MGQNFFTSDLHIGHRSIIKYTVRGPIMVGCPQQGEEEEVEKSEMDRRMAIHDAWALGRINATVGPTDYLYIVGDLFFGDKWLAAHWIDQIRTKHRILIGGNHDDKLMDFYKWSGLFEEVHDHRLEIKVNGVIYNLDHHPAVEWSRGHRGAIHLHGHCHGNFDYKAANLHDKKILDIGWDNSLNVLGEYTPFSLEQVNEYMKDRVNITHHNKAG